MGRKRKAAFSRGFGAKTFDPARSKMPAAQAITRSEVKDKVF